MTHQKFIVITSINKPSEAIREFAKWNDWKLIVIGDKKSPSVWHQDNVIYLSLKDQYKKFPNFKELLPINTYTRKMLGYIYAFEQGATIIFESDDDNIPYPNANKDIELDIESDKKIGTVIGSSSGWLNVYAEFGAPKCWPRGFPLDKIKDHQPIINDQLNQEWGILQYLADEDPDVDAVYRMTVNEPVFFARNHAIRLAEFTYSPFNSQATLWTKEFFPLMFLPVGIPDRVTDILRGYMALACLWKYGKTLAYKSPVLYQKRNPHNLSNDFQQEMDLYLSGKKWSQQLLLASGSNPSELFSNMIKQLVLDGYLPEINNTLYREFSESLK